MTTLLEAFGWAVMHLTWQGGVIWLVWRAFHSRQATANERYLAGAASLLSLGVLFACTILFYFRADAPAVVLRYVGGLMPAARQIANTAEPLSLFQQIAAWTGAVWLLVTCILCLRLILRWRGSRAVYGRNTMPAHPQLGTLVSALVPRLGLRSAPPVRGCADIDSPAVFGAFKVVLVFPTSGLEYLTIAQLRGVVAHELMHVRRRDGMANLAQCILDALFWFHPAAGSISRAIRAEREKICDAVAASVCGNPHDYVTGLVKLEESRLGDGRFVLAARRGALLERAQHLLLQRPDAASTPFSFAAAATLVALGLAAVIAWPSTSRAGALRNAPDEFTVAAVDPAGAFSLTIRHGRAIAASVDGAAVPRTLIQQKRDSVFLLDQRGIATLAVRVKPSGISWAARSPSLGHSLSP